jgi:hypothetical protein
MNTVGGVMVIRLFIYYADLVKVALKRKKKGDGKRSGWVGECVELWKMLGFWPLCVFECISVIVVEGVFVRNCRGWGCVQLVE